MNKRLNDKIEWALNEEAARMVNDMEKKGFDRDLAIEVITSILGEAAVYTLPDEEEECSCD